MGQNIAKLCLFRYTVHARKTYEKSNGVTDPMEIIELIYKVAGIVGMLFGLCYFYQIVYIFLPFFKA